MLEMIGKVWGYGNFYARLCLILVVGELFLIPLVALIGIPSLTAIVGMMPFVALVMVLIGFIDPMVILGLYLIDGRKTMFKAFAALMAVEIVWALYFVNVPVRNNPGLVPLVILVVLGLVFAFIAKGKIGKWALGILIPLFFVYTAAFNFPKTFGALGPLKQAIDGAASTVIGIFTANTRGDPPPLPEFHSLPSFVTYAPNELRAEVVQKFVLSRGSWSKAIFLSKNPVYVSVNKEWCLILLNEKNAYQKNQGKDAVWNMSAGVFAMNGGELAKGGFQAGYFVAQALQGGTNVEVLETEKPKPEEKQAEKPVNVPPRPVGNGGGGKRNNPPPAKDPGTQQTIGATTSPQAPPETGPKEDPSRKKEGEAISVVKRSGLVFSLNKAVREADEVRIDFTVKNTGEDLRDLRIVLMDDSKVKTVQTILYGDHGQNVTAKSAQLGNKISGGNDPFGFWKWIWVAQTIAPGVVMPGKMIFEGVSNQTTKIALLDVVFNSGNEEHARFKNIAIESLEDAPEVVLSSGGEPPRTSDNLSESSDAVKK